jgi:hypothetical protein
VVCGAVPTVAKEHPELGREGPGQEASQNSQASLTSSAETELRFSKLFCSVAVYRSRVFAVKKLPRQFVSHFVRCGSISSGDSLTVIMLHNPSVRLS